MQYTINKLHHTMSNPTKTVNEVRFGPSGELLYYAVEK
jgi:hypothetical protein